MIKLIMKKKSLMETNPYLRDPELREALLNISVATSTAVEGMKIKIPKLSRRLQKKMREIIVAQEAARKDR